MPPLEPRPTFALSLASAMLPLDVLFTALAEIRANKLRSFFTLLGIIVSVAFLVAVVAVIQGMNAYVKENVANSLIGTQRVPGATRADPDRLLRRRGVEAGRRAGR